MIQDAVEHYGEHMPAPNDGQTVWLMNGATEATSDLLVLNLSGSDQGNSTRRYTYRSTGSAGERKVVLCGRQQ